ncbi:MAG: response regulator [Bacillota bacterium]
MSKVDVVVVDDDKSVRWLLEEMLSFGEISHRVAASGPEGIRLIQEHKPRLAIVDVRLGSMNGLDVARRTTNGGTKVIFMTGYGDVIKDKVEDDLPVISIIEKPFDIQGLLRIVRNVLDETA